MKKIMVSMILMILFCFGYQNYHGCALAPDNLTGWVVVLDSTIVLKTTDGGAHWFEQSTPATRRFFDVTCVNNQIAWTCGILGEITHTVNGGQNWAVQIVGLSKYATRIEFMDANTGWTSCGDGVLGKTTDGGSYWEQIFTPFPNLPEFYGVSFLDANNLWMVSGWPDSIANGQGWIVRSSDSGFNWDSIYQCANKDDYLDVYFLNAQTGIVVGGNDSTYAPIIFKTTNTGAAWNLITAPGGTSYLRAVDFVGNKGWAVGKFGTIIHTSDAGNSWTFQMNPATTTLFDVDFSDTLHGMACGLSIVLYTTNGGQTWNNGTPGISEGRQGSIMAERLLVRPNPSSGHVEIRYDLKNAAGHAVIQIYDVLGKRVVTLGRSAADNVPLIWRGMDQTGKAVPDGVYFVSLSAGGKKQQVKLILKR